MNDRTHDDMLDDVAVYALGSMPAPDAARVRAHIATCAECRAEYAALAPAAATLSIAAEGPQSDAKYRPSPLLKGRIMRQVRADAAPRPRAPVWPAYLVAAASIAIALISSFSNVSLSGQLRDTRNELAQATQRSSSLSRDLAGQRATISDLMSSDAKRYMGQGSGEVIASGRRLYIAMSGLPAPPRGKVYQAWTLPHGSTTMVPSVTFLPDAHGVAVIPLSADARLTNAVAVSVEPEGGSKQPTSKPVLVVPLT